MIEGYANFLENTDGSILFLEDFICGQAEMYLHEKTGVRIIGSVEIKKGARIYTGVTIGCPAETYPQGERKGWVIIGPNVVLRENVVVQAPTEDETRIAEGAYIMHGCHVAHDCFVGANAILSPRVVLGGHCQIMDHANLGMGSLFHQFTTVGPYAMIGAGSVVVKDIPPYYLAKGNPALISRTNSRHFDKAEMSFITAINKMFHKVRHQHRSVAPIPAPIDYLLNPKTT